LTCSEDIDGTAISKLNYCFSFLNPKPRFGEESRKLILNDKIIYKYLYLQLEVVIYLTEVQKKTTLKIDPWLDKNLPPTHRSIAEVLNPAL
jgi:hypothetical protein